MAWTTEDLDKLKAAIATGAKTVKYADKEVDYRSLSEMIAIKKTMEQELGLLPAGSKHSYPSFSKGLC